jgi:tRNA dimethylallyltransferase
MNPNNAFSKILIVVGPTASGKSFTAMRLAETLNGEIICADSRTIYKGMDIGTAKPSKTDRIMIKHHLLDVVIPDQEYTVANFVSDAKHAIANIQSRGKTAVVVGGSGMYVDALLYDYRFRKPTGMEQQEVARLDDTQLMELAKQLYPQASQNFVFKNRRRVEQLLTRGPAMNDDRSVIKLNAAVVGINPPKAELQERIGHRTQELLNNGFVHEVQQLISKYGILELFEETIGYRQVLEYLAGDIDKSQLAERISTATRQYAKRQLTWFGRNKDIIWFDTGQDLVIYVEKNLET